MNNYFLKQFLVEPPCIDVAIEIILKQCLLDIRFIIEVLADPGNMQTYTEFVVVLF